MAASDRPFRAAAPLAAALLLLPLLLLLAPGPAGAHRTLHGDLSAAADQTPQQQQPQRRPWDPTVGVTGGTRPLVISHRGSPGQLPDHTLAGYRRAIAEGTDCVECDVVVTKDLKLICRHEPWLQNTTDAPKKFPKAEKTYDIPEAGGKITGIFSIDLTLDEIKQLRTAQPLPFRDQSYNYKDPVPTFEEYVKIVADFPDRVVCIYPETKHPTFFNNHPVLKNAKTTIDDLLMAEMKRLGYDLQAPIGSPAWLKRPAFIQSFEQNNLRYWKSKTKLPLVQLVDDVPAVDTKATPEYLLSEKGIKEISQYAWGYAPWKGLYVIVDGATNSITKINPEPLRLARKYNMPVTVWTLRNEPSYLAKQYKGNAANEFNLLFNVLGVMGGFTDHTFSLVPWVRASYKPAPPGAAAKAAAGDSSVYATAGKPAWAVAPVCQVAPTKQNPIVNDTQGHPWLTDQGVSCAYRHPVQFPKPQPGAARRAHH